jgi:hypothetical protein
MISQYGVRVLVSDSTTLRTTTGSGFGSRKPQFGQATAFVEISCPQSGQMTNDIFFYLFSNNFLYQKQTIFNIYRSSKKIGQAVCHWHKTRYYLGFTIFSVACRIDYEVVRRDNDRGFGRPFRSSFQPKNRWLNAVFRA